VGNGSEAVQVWQQGEGSFDAIFMDVQMPVMDGFQATRRIRELESARGGHIPIVAMTAYAMKADMEKCREAGMDDYVSKPFRPEDVLAALKRLYTVGAHEPERYHGTVSSIHTELLNHNGDIEAQPTVASSDILSVFDKDELLYRLGGKDEMVPRFLAMFAKNVSGYLEALHLAIDTENEEQVRIQAHTIKGMSANISAHKMKSTASALEVLAGEGRLNDCKKLVEQLESEFIELKQATRQ
jgi:CheY-like chemotaxis protein/HPt (histidine-containing phosphotransfer) domain-containing protein